MFTKSRACLITKFSVIFFFSFNVQLPTTGKRCRFTSTPALLTFVIVALSITTITKTMSTSHQTYTPAEVRELVDVLDDRYRAAAKEGTLEEVFSRERKALVSFSFFFYCFLLSCGHHYSSGFPNDDELSDPKCGRATRIPSDAICLAGGRAIPGSQEITDHRWELVEKIRQSTSSLRRKSSQLLSRIRYHIPYPCRPPPYPRRPYPRRPF